MKTIKDFLGNAIEVGAEIVYAASVGRSPVLVHAEVIEIRPEDYIEPGTFSFHRKASLVIKPLKRLYGDEWMTKDKKIPLRFPERCLVVRK